MNSPSPLDRTTLVMLALICTPFFLLVHAADGRGSVVAFQQDSAKKRPRSLLPGESQEAQEETDNEEPPNPRVDRIVEKLDQLFNADSKSLDSSGKLELTYEFSKKEEAAAQDWRPEVSGGNQSKNGLRWTVRREDIWHTKGLKISNQGYFLHKAKIQPPLEIEVTIYIENQFAPKNLIAVAWVDRKGKGVGSVYGHQTCRVSKMRGVKRTPGKLPSLDSKRRYTFTVRVEDGMFHAKTRASKLPPQKLPKKMKSGRAALIWGGTVAAVVEKVTIRGKLDLEWAEKELELD